MRRFLDVVLTVGQVPEETIMVGTRFNEEGWLEFEEYGGTVTSALIETRWSNEGKGLEGSEEGRLRLQRVGGMVTPFRR